MWPELSRTISLAGTSTLAGPPTLFGARLGQPCRTARMRAAFDVRPIMVPRSAWVSHCLPARLTSESHAHWAHRRAQRRQMGKISPTLVCSTSRANVAQAAVPETS
jgi:hypothetical protein